jgi:hypothetical protein
MTIYLRHWLLKFSCCVGFFVFFAVQLNAAVIFEGYFKIMASGAHTGYLVSRYEIVEAKSEFHAKHFMKTNKLGGNINESIISVSDLKFRPKKYTYTLVSPEGNKTINFEVVKGKYNLVIENGGKKETMKGKSMPKDVFFSRLVDYALASNPQKINSKSNYKYVAIAEEDGSQINGVAVVKGEALVGKTAVFKIEHTLDRGPKIPKETFEELISKVGDSIFYQNKSLGITAELVPQSGLATADMGLSSEILKGIFGEVPIGVINPVSKSVSDNPPPKKTPQVFEEPKFTEPGKQEGVPQGQGVQIKGGKTQ